MSNVITQKDLKDACKELHDRAETTRLAQDLITGTIDSHIYNIYCYQLYLIADAIEQKIDIGKNLARRNSLVQDIALSPASRVDAVPATTAYVQYLTNLNVDKIKGHIYAHYLGWLYGGQMIAKKLSLPKNHLTFENVKECVDHVRDNILVDLTVDDAEEAKIAFTFIILMYNELYELY
jgi:heme oxygenase